MSVANQVNKSVLQPDIAVEFGNARYQSVMDRYITGRPVPFRRLRMDWEDTTQGAVWTSPDYKEFFAAFQSRNRLVPPRRCDRVRYSRRALVLLRPTVELS